MRKIQSHAVLFLPLIVSTYRYSTVYSVFLPCPYGGTKQIELQADRLLICIAYKAVTPSDLVFSASFEYKFEVALRVVNRRFCCPILSRM